MRCSACGREFDPLVDGPITEDDGTAYCSPECHCLRWTEIKHGSRGSSPRWSHVDKAYRTSGVSIKDAPGDKLGTWQETRDELRGKGLSGRKVLRFGKGVKCG